MQQVREKDIKKSEQLRYMDERMRDSNMYLNGCFRGINGKKKGSII